MEKLGQLKSEDGFLLPRETHFAIYGVTDSDHIDWQRDGLWSDLPGPGNGKKLGTSTIERSQSRGIFGIEGKPLVEFTNQYGDNLISFVWVRETGKSGKEFSSKVLVRAFASNRHPDAVGLAFELIIETPSEVTPAARNSTVGQIFHLFIRQDFTGERIREKIDTSPTRRS